MHRRIGNHDVGRRRAQRAVAQERQVTVCFFGDGASNSGSFYEGLNLASVWNLPVVYVCENNLYATEMSLERATKSLDIAARAAIFKMPGVTVDGSDARRVYEAAGEAISRARKDGGPTLIECKTYRFHGHHEGDPGTHYRSKEEIESWKKRIPSRRCAKARWRRRSPARTNSTP